MKIYQKFSYFVLGCCLFCILTTNVSAQVDWTKEVVESTMSRYSPASKLGSWNYMNGFYLYAQYRVWQKLGDEKYFQYIKDWLDYRIDDSGNFYSALDWLDHMQPGLVTLCMYEETKEQKYKLAAEKIRNVFDTYPRTSDGAFWHAKSKEGELWLDGVYMSMPFLMKYGQLFGDTTYCYNEATQQIILYASHLKDITGLLYHGYDEDGFEWLWTDSVTHHSPDFWGRSMGWFGMAIIEILEILPEHHPNRAVLVEILRDLITGLANYQDEKTGLWYQVVDKGDELGNWIETSCSCMYTFFTARAVERGYVDSSFIEVAVKGYEGVLAKISIGEDGLTYLKDICEGTGVGEYGYYTGRARKTNIFHGLGAFLLASLEIQKYISDLGANRLPIAMISSPRNNGWYTKGEDITITVDASDLDGTVTHVEVYKGDNLFFSDDQQPWEYIWSNAASGNYVFTAVAYDDSNASNRSSPINITVFHQLRYYAEDAVISEGRIISGHRYKEIDLDNKVGSYAEWLVSIPKAGNWDIDFTCGFTTKPPTIAPFKVELNGVVLDSSFADWLGGSDDELTNIWFESGENTVRVTSISSEPTPYINCLYITFSNDNTNVFEEKPLQPMSFALYQNYPNPFNPTTTIRYSLAKPSRVQLNIYNIQGQKIRTLVTQFQDAGQHTVIWDAKDEFSNDVSSGVYLYQISAPDFCERKKMILLR